MSEVQSRPLPSAPDTTDAPQTWDVGTLALTGFAAFAIVGALGTAMELALPTTLGAASVLGAVVGLLAGYQPLHEDDAAAVDASTDKRWRRGGSD